MRQTIPSGTRLPTIRGFSKSILSNGEEQFLTHVSPTRTAFVKLSLYCGKAAVAVGASLPSMLYFGFIGDLLHSGIAFHIVVTFHFLIDDKLCKLLQITQVPCGVVDEEHCIIMLGRPVEDGDPGRTVVKMPASKVRSDNNEGFIGAQNRSKASGHFRNQETVLASVQTGARGLKHKRYKRGVHELVPIVAKLQ